jgi:hypothetical protein
MTMTMDMATSRKDDDGSLKSQDIGRESDDVSLKSQDVGRESNNGS